MTVEQWLQANGYGAVVSGHKLSSDDSCETKMITTASGATLCIKCLRSAEAPEHFFEAEAAGLQALACAQQRNARGILVPEVIAQATNFLVLSYIEPGQATEQGWRQLAEGLALMHQQKVPYFGFPSDNFCGLTPQPNPPSANGFEFFAEHRLLYQGRLALAQNRLTQHDLNKLQALANKLPQLLPEQPAALIHGDLWSGNVLFDSSGAPAFIDPACYYGWAEAELAMTALFGGFPEVFYQHYQNINLFEQGWRERFPLYNLYHLLNHLNLFGGHYYQQIMSILKRF